MGKMSLPVVPIKRGLEQNKEPFLLENDAFPVLNDAYIYQGKILRKQGNRKLGRIVQIEVDGALGNVTADPFIVNVFTALPGIGTLGIDPGSVSINIAAVPITYTDDGQGNLTAPGPYTGTINYQTGSISINVPPAAIGNAATITLNYYTGRPVMGLFERERTVINAEDTIAFDTAKANIWNRGAQRFEDISTDIAGAEILWTSSNSDFFWGTNYYVDTGQNKLFWVTNNKQYSVSGGGLDQDGIMVYNGTGWEVQTPQLNSTGGNRFLNGCLLLVAYKDRMIALNTLESSAASGVVATRYYNRARWSQNGVPYTDTIPGFDATAWQDDVTGKGGYIDAPTSEAIVSVGFYKDVLIVFFERSTWQLTYTGEAGLPFVWNKVNTSYGSESTFSTIQFDKGIFAVGDKAIVVSDNYNVVRIDEQIPLKVYQFHNDNNGPIRVHGIRDYYYRFAYWTYTDHTQNKTFPDKILVYNYEENAYSVFNDSYTCFGYYQPAEDLTWENANFSWVSANFSWDSNRFQSEFPSIIAGNQVGYVMLFNDTTSQDTSLYITNITQAQQPLVTIPNHNLNLNQYVKFANVVGMTEINEETGKIVDVIDANTIQVDIDSSAFTAYDIGGEVSVLGNINVSTKRYNPFFLNEKQVRMNYIDFYVDKTAEGEFNVDLFIDTSDSHPVATATTPTFQNYGPTISMDKMWQRVYLEGGGQFLQFVLYLNDDQMKDQSIQEANIVINAMNLSIEPAGNLLGYNL